MNILHLPAWSVVIVNCSQAAASAQPISQSRLRSDDETRSSRPTHNRLIASSLLDLLQERKYITTQKQLEELVNKYDVDLDKIQRLASHVNSVSVDQNTVKRWVGEDGAEHVTMLVSVSLSLYTCMH